MPGQPPPVPARPAVERILAGFGLIPNAPEPRYQRNAGLNRAARRQLRPQVEAARFWSRLGCPQLPAVSIPGRRWGDQ